MPIWDAGGFSFRDTGIAIAEWASIGSTYWSQTLAYGSVPGALEEDTRNPITDNNPDIPVRD